MAPMNLQKGETMKQMKKNYDLAELEIIRFPACDITCDIISTSGEQGGNSGGYDGPGIIDPDWDTN